MVARRVYKLGYYLVGCSVVQKAVLMATLPVGVKVAWTVSH